MDRIRLLRTLSRAASVLNRVGLGAVNQAGARVVHRLFVRGPLVVEWDGLRIQGSFDSWPLLRQIESGTFEPHTIRLFQEKVRPGMTVIDVGANVGLFTLLAARQVGPSGRVFAFEPDPRNLADLETNIQANGCTNVTVIPQAASSQVGESAFHMRRPAGHSGLYADVEKYLRKTRIQTTTLDTVMDGQHVDVLKLDVEGAEIAALRGAPQTLARTQTMFVEYAPFALEAAGGTGNELLAMLRERFDSVRVVDEHAHKLVSFQEMKRGNLLCE